MQRKGHDWLIKLGCKRSINSSYGLGDTGDSWPMSPGDVQEEYERWPVLGEGDPAMVELCSVISREPESEAVASTSSRVVSELPRQRSPPFSRRSQSRRDDPSAAGNLAKHRKGSPAESRGSDAPADFSRLPPDVLRHILGNLLPRESVARLACCSKGWREATRDMLTALNLFRMGKRHRRGRKGARKCADSALQCFLGAAERGLPAAMVDAGVMLWEQGVREEAIHWFREAAKQGNTTAMMNLALALQEQAGEQSRTSPAEETGLVAETEALQWLLQSAKRGCAKAQYSLALALHHGSDAVLGTSAAQAAVAEGLQGVEAAALGTSTSLHPGSGTQNPGSELRMRAVALWYKQAAEAGNSRAMYNLSKCLADGVGVPQDLALSDLWLRRAAAAGHAAAVEDIRALEGPREEGEMLGLDLRETQGQGEVGARQLSAAASQGVAAANDLRDIQEAGAGGDSEDSTKQQACAMTLARQMFRELRAERDRRLSVQPKKPRQAKAQRLTPPML